MPNKDIYFHGFGVFASYDNKDITYNVKWIIGDEDTDPPLHTISFENAQKDEHRCHTIMLEQLGEKPVKVSEGTKIHCVFKTDNNDTRRCCYGECGSSTYYRNISGQDHIFEMSSSNYNSNGGTTSDWG